MAGKAVKVAITIPSLDSITTVPKDALSRRLTALRATQVVAVNAAIKYALALP
jgi:mRNA-degrading endonuclease toxin of MazEF toxin-antitoxin module